MARPKKTTVDYFPHYCQHKKTMYILEQRYGNDGYAFWFKLLELLGDTEGHYINCNNEATWEFLQAKTRLDSNLCHEILNLLAKLDAIDPELWAQKVVWSQNFVDGIADVYKNRRTNVPSKPDLNSFYRQKPRQDEVSTDKNPQSKVKESKVNKSTLQNSTVCSAEVETHDTDNGEGPKTPGVNEYPADFEAFWQAYPKARRKEKRAAFKAWKTRLKQGKAKGLTPDKLITAARHYAAEMAAKGKEPEYIKLPKTFLGPNAPFEDYIDPPKEQGLDPPKAWSKLRKYINPEEVFNYDSG